MFGEMFDKFVRYILATTITMKNFDFGIELSVGPCFKGFVGAKGFGFAMEQIEMSKLGVVIRKRSKVATSTNGLNWSGPPDIRMYLTPKCSRTLAFADFGNRLTSALCECTRLAEDRFIICCI
jgi:hypothetical protein